MDNCPCHPDRQISISAKCDDRCVVKYQDTEHHGYVPSGLGIGGGDYIVFKFCASCGKIAGFERLCSDQVDYAIKNDR